MKKAAAARVPTTSCIYALDDYVPHVVGGVGWTGGWGGVSVVAGYDAVFDEGAIKGRVDFNVNDAISLFVMGAWSSNDDSDWDQRFDRPDARTTTLLGAASGLSGSAAPGSSPSRRPFNLEVGYDDFENFAVAANVDYELVNNFHIIPEIIYEDNTTTSKISSVLEDSDEWGGFLRLQANFGG